MMDIEFAHSRLALIETDRAADTKLPVVVIQPARQRLRMIRAAPDVRTMLNWKSLGLGPRGGAADEHAIVITPQWNMMLRIEEQTSGLKVVVKALEEQLQGGDIHVQQQ
jgi:plasmid maintenance system killer protein